MDKRDWASLDDAQLEAALTEGLGEDVPDDVVARVNPWDFAMTEVLIGMALCTFTLNFWYLNYILPFFGMMLTMLGFRTLRRGNKWFGRCFMLSAARLAIRSLALVLEATILFETVFPSWSQSVLLAADQLALFALLYCLWHGLRAAQRAAGLPPDAQGVAVLAIWYVILLALAALSLGGWIVFIVLLVFYIFVLRSLFRLSDELAEAGYLLQAAPVRIPDRMLTLLLSAAVLVACALGTLLGSRYAMDWQEVAPTEHAQVQETREKLLALGFPEDVLGDLVAEDIALCDNAVQVITDSTYNYVDGAKLYTTDVGVKLDDDGAERWVILRHFRWADNATFCGTELLRVWAGSDSMYSGWRRTYGPSGRVLYDKNGRTYAAEYEHLERDTYSYTNFFGENVMRNDILAAFSLPRHGENRRGYVAYSLLQTQEGYSISSWVDYSHQTSLLQYPVQTALKRQMTGTLRGGNAFATIQDAFELWFIDGELQQIR